MTMRAAWWLLKLVWRVATHARVALGLLPSPRIVLVPDRPAVAAVVPRVATGAVCDRPPVGWSCSRGPSHDGPCAPRPTEWPASTLEAGEAPGWSLGGQLDADERPPRANLADWLEGQPTDVVESIREIARAYEKTFCGACGAGPDDPTKRCATCLVRLERMVARSTNDELGRLRELVQRGAI